MTTDERLAPEHKQRLRRPIRRLIVTASVVLTAGVLVYLSRQPLLRSLHDSLDVSDPLQHSDYVFPLFGNNSARPIAAALLIKTGWADYGIIERFAQDARTDGSQPKSTTEVIFEHYEVPRQRLVHLQQASSNTQEEMLALGVFLDEHPAATVTVVTDPTHIRRARWTARNALGDDSDRLRWYAAPLVDYHRNTWWRSDTGFTRVTGEYVKLLGYWLAYSSTPYWLAAVLVIVPTAGWTWRVWYRRKCARPD
jgi:uncharacterized SAM-binding protein YcdF (DUF218 family)